MKIGRNDPCWCGSGKKHKKCHLNREAEPAVNFRDVDALLKKTFSKKDCLAPASAKSDCSGGIVRAHSVAKSWLRKIAVDSHVYGLSASLAAMRRNDGRVVPEKIGINKASTFTGFCAAHDKSIFSRIEDAEFSCTAEQCFLLAYRSLTREFFAKQSVLSSISDMRTFDRGMKSERQQTFQAFMKQYEIGTSKGHEDLLAHKEEYDALLQSGDYRDVEYYIVELSCTPDVLTSGGVYISHDFNGKVLQDLGDLDRRLDGMHYSLIPTAKGGAAVFTWLKSSAPSCQRFVNSLHALDHKDMGNALVRFVFEFCENNYLSRSWWDGLAESCKEALIDRANVAVNLMTRRLPGCLLDDGLEPVQWPIEGIMTNVQVD